MQSILPYLSLIRFVFFLTISPMAIDCIIDWEDFLLYTTVLEHSFMLNASEISPQAFPPTVADGDIIRTFSDSPPGASDLININFSDSPPGGSDMTNCHLVTGVGSLYIPFFLLLPKCWLLCKCHQSHCYKGHSISVCYLCVRMIHKRPRDSCRLYPYCIEGSTGQSCCFYSDRQDCSF